MSVQLDIKEVKDAIEKALSGNEEGYTILYEKTWQSKYYLALQYMKNKEAAEDVLQESYIKAFQRLDTLQSPEAFDKWLGMIVANTARNMLAKKNPTLFTDMAVDNEGEAYIYDVEDEDPENQPELAYTQEETKELVHQMMDELSEEQRMCILMFHLECASIAEIAKAMNCSENTIKSRLNYGRKNLRSKAEELKKKGYKLYGLAPIPFLLYLLHSDQEAMTMDGALTAVGRQTERAILQKLQSTAGNGISRETAKTTTKKAVHEATSKTGKSIQAKTAAKFLQTAAGKGLVAAVTACVIGAGAYGVYHWNQQKNVASKQTTASAKEDIKSQSGEEESAKSSKQAAEEQNTKDENKKKQNTEQTAKENTQKENTNVENTQEKNTQKENTQKENRDESGIDLQKIRSVYEKILKDVQNGVYDFSYVEDSTQYQYFVHDIDGDGIPELGVASLATNSPIIQYDVRLFSCKQTDREYEPVVISGDEMVMALDIPEDGKGLLSDLFSRGNGMHEIHRITVKDDKMIYGESEQTFQLGSDEETAFYQKNQAVEWKEVTDLSGLTF